MFLKAMNTKFETMAIKTQTITWDMLRIGCGIMLVGGHGYGKMFGEKARPFFGGLDFFGIDLGVNMMWVAGFIEFYIGILIILGLFTRWAALLTATLMVMAYLSSHLAWFPTFNGGELATVYFLIFITIVAYGPGPFSLDAKLFGNKSG
jgi:putative oxidoreductase